MRLSTATSSTARARGRRRCCSSWAKGSWSRDSEGIAKMSCGQIRLFTIPPALGYGVIGYLPVVPPGATLSYEVELIAFSMEDDPEQPKR